MTAEREPNSPTPDPPASPAADLRSKLPAIALLVLVAVALVALLALDHDDRPAIARIPIPQLGASGTAAVALEPGARIDFKVYVATAEVRDRTDDDVMLQIELLRDGQVALAKPCIGIPWQKKSSGRGHNYPSDGCVTTVPEGGADQIRVGAGWRKGTGRALYTGIAVNVQWAEGYVAPAPASSQAP